MKVGDTGKCSCGCNLLCVVNEVLDLGARVTMWASDTNQWHKNIPITSIKHEKFTDQLWADYCAWRLVGSD